MDTTDMETAKLNMHTPPSTPAFILNEMEVVKNINGFKSALNTRFPKNIVGYSVKTNSLPYVLRIARDHGCYAEVVSYHEYRLALTMGFSPERIIYNGPLKSKETFLEAIEKGAVVNIENWREICWLKDLPQEKKYSVGIRINVNISAVSPEDEAFPDDDSRFGFSYESGDLKKAIDMINRLSNVRLAGIHSHREPKTRSVRFYSRVIEYVQDIILKYGLQLDYWDLGGGFFGMMPGKPRYQDYVDAFYNVLCEKLRKLCFIVEPGNAIVASGFDYVMEVIDVKEHDAKIYVCTDGTRNDVDPFFHKSDYFKEIFYKDQQRSSVDKIQIVSGLSCLEYDRLFQLPAGSKKLEPGDRIIFHRVGAYTMTLSPLFIHYFPNVYMMKDNEYTLIRKEWSEKQFLEQSIY